MIGNAMTKFIAYNRRLSMLTIFLASLAFLIVVISIVAFIYVTRKEKILRKLHLISILIILLVEIVFLISVIICCWTQSRSILGHILAFFFIVVSLLALMILIYFLLEDIIKERIGPCPNDASLYKSYEIRGINSIDRHDSPIRTSADEKAIPINTPTVLSSWPRLPTSTLFSTSDNNMSSTTPSPYIVTLDKARRDLLVAIDERSISALEEAIQQVKDYNYIHQLKYECERALELLNRLIKIEHMKIRVLRLTQSTIAELHSYTKPPDEVYTVMRATFLLLGHSDKDMEEWPKIQNLLGRLGKESVRRRCYELNPLNIAVDKAHEAKDILQNYDLIRVSEISFGLAAFYSWATTMIDEREKLLESQGRIID